jgi:hypothetical protein
VQIKVFASGAGQFTNLASVTRVVAPTDTDFAVTVRVVPAARYTVVVAAFGVQELPTEDLTVYGLQYYGEATIVPLPGSPPAAVVNIQSAVPDPTDGNVEGERVLEWPPVQLATGYSVCPFGFLGDDSKTLRVDGTSVVVPDVCTDYRVRAEFRAGMHGAYSADFSIGCGVRTMR